MPIEYDKERLLKSLYNYGHFWNPAYPEGHNVDPSHLSKLTPADRISQEAISSWQNADANFDALSLIIHLRGIVADGNVGPVTAAMMNAKRCAMPDFAPPPTASFHYDDPGLQAAVESYQKYAEAYIGGSGSWPKGCDPSRPKVHSVVAGISMKNASTFQKANIDAIIKMVEETEAEIGQSVRHVLDGSVSSPQHDIRFEFISGSVIGYSYFPDPNNCDQVVKCRIDNSFDANVPVLAQLLTHEYKGHSDGLQHTRGGIMNPSIGSPTSRSSWIGDPSQSIKFRYFGGLPIPTDGPPPVDPPTSDHNGVFVFDGKVFKIKVFPA